MHDSLKSLLALRAVTNIKNKIKKMVQAEPSFNGYESTPAAREMAAVHVQHFRLS